MELLIDTWNVLHQTGILPPESTFNGIRGLIRLLGSSRWSQDRISLICDGTPCDTDSTGAQIELFFTGPHRTADDEIMHRVKESSAKRSILVVTSDREIIRSIKAAGSQHLSSVEFLQILVNDNAIPRSKKVHRPSRLSASGAQAWKEEFGFDEEEIEELMRSAEQDLPKADEQNPIKTEPPPCKQSRKQDEPTLPPELLEEARRLLGDGS